MSKIDFNQCVQWGNCCPNPLPVFKSLAVRVEQLTKVFFESTCELFASLTILRLGFFRLMSLPTYYDDVLEEPIYFRQFTPFEMVQSRWVERRRDAKYNLKLPVPQLNSKLPKEFKEGHMIRRDRLIAYHTADAALKQLMQTPKDYRFYKEAQSEAYKKYMRGLDKLTRLSKIEPRILDKTQYIKQRSILENKCAKRAIRYARADGALKAHVELLALAFNLWKDDGRGGCAPGGDQWEGATIDMRD